MADLISMLAGASGIGAEEADPFFNQTTLLLHGDGTNGAQNNTFLDSSTNNFTITRNPTNGPNAPTQGTFSPFSLAAGEWSNFFDGTGDYLSIADNAALRIGTQDFWIEAWVYVTSFSAINTIAIKRTFNTTGTGTWAFVIDTNGAVDFDQIQTGATIITTANSAVSLNTWTHIAVGRDSSDAWRIFINGVSSGTSTPTDNFDFSTTQPLVIGNVRDANDYSFKGYISNFRFIIGSTLYTSNFTPPTTPLTNVTNTVLLTCQSNRFVDNSTANSGTGFAITRNGDVKVTPFSPFAPTAAYSASTNGGSGYFDGTGDYLSIADAAALDLASGDFTIEAWIYLPVAPGADDRLFKKWALTSGYMLFFQNITGTLRFIYRDALGGGPDFQGAGVVIGQWNHVAVTRSTNTYNIWVNGASVANTTNTALIVDNALNLNIGGDDVLFEGYMSQFRILKGTALYTSAFTPPTALLTAISNTSLLCNFTNAGIFDNTGKNVLETVGNAQVDTSVKKFGLGSMKFDGSGDYLLVPKFWDIAASENFTIECWIYLTAAQASYRAIISDINSANLGSSKYIMISSTGLEIQTGTTAGTISTITQSFSQNTWYHLAVVRSSGTISVYVDGVSKTVSQSSQTGAFLDQGTSFYIGRWASTAYEFYGYIDDLRITKGVARYTANFTPPTAAFPNE